MSFVTRAWAVAFCALSACQVVSGIAPLDIDDDRKRPDASTGTRDDAVKPAAGSGGANGGSGATGGTTDDSTDAGPKDAGIDSGHDAGPPPCERPEGAECNWQTACGCEENEHCQARGADAKWTCVKRGKKQLGESCSSADECAEGTCDQNLCRVYCEDAGDCDLGQCLPATGEGGKPLEDVKVCWRACQVGSTDACPSGTTCQTRELDGKKAAFCIPPANPCPTVEDGKCDEPVMCAAGTDSVDCSCEKPEGAECDHVAQCGCPQGKSCKLAEATFDPICVAREGTAKTDEHCMTHADCDDGLACTSNPYGSCHKYCAERSDCPGENDSCGQVVNSNGEDIPGFKICLTGCSESSPCPPNNSCVKSADGSFCRPFVPEIPGGACNLSLQRGCDSTPGTACVATDGTTACVTHNGQRPRGSACSSSSECEAGNMCLFGVCRHYCDDTGPQLWGVQGCVEGGVCTAPPLANGGRAAYKVCIERCTSDSDCDDGLLCYVGQVGNTAGFCAAPTSPCPTNNGVCDEPIPRGTGSCEAGEDSADCEGSP